jgi:phosphotransferase system IIA component
MKALKTLVLLCLITPLNLLFGQNVGINTTGAVPDASSILDISSTDKGVLIPRVNIIDITTAAPITAPINSLLVYNTNVTSGVGFYFWNGTKWINLTDNTGNADEDWYEVGTTTDPDDINDNIFSMGNVSIGVNTTANNLEVSSANDPTTIRITETSGTDVNWELRAYNVALGGPNNQFSIWGGLDGSTQTDRFVIAETGEVGIGTISPTNTLHVSGGIASGVIKIEADTDNITESDQAYILMEQDGAAVQAHLGFGSTEATGDVFRIALKGGIIPSIDYNTFTINAQNKRVGINTSNANKPLSVFGTGTPANMTGGGPWASDRRLSS